MRRRYRDCRFGGAVPFLSALAVLVACIAFFSFIITLFDAPDSLVSFMSNAALAAACYTAAYLTARRRRRHGMYCGLAIALGVYAAVFLAGLIFAELSFSGGSLVKLFLLVICGVCGGVKGVNTRFVGK